MKIWDTVTASSIPALADVTSYNILTAASVDDLVEKMRDEGKDRTAAAVSAVWFRANVVVRTDSGEPFQEDTWTDVIRIGGATLDYAKPCNRCLSVQIDPATGVLEPEGPLGTLKSYRQWDRADKRRRAKLGDSPIFGQHFGIVEKGAVKVGDEVFVGEYV